MPTNPVTPDLIDVSTPDSGNGDPLRTGGVKINETDTDLASATNALADVLGVEIGDLNLGPSFSNNNVKQALNALSAASSTVVTVSLFPLADDAVSDLLLLAPQNYTITQLRVLATRIAPASAAGTILMDIINGASSILSTKINLETLSAGTPLPVTPDTTSVTSGDILTVEVESDNADAEFGGLYVQLVLEPA